MKKRYTDPPERERCTAQITLRDGSTARCGRKKAKRDESYCWQHRNIDMRVPDTFTGEGISVT